MNNLLSEIILFTKHPACIMLVLAIIFTMIQRLFCTETILEKRNTILMIIACTHNIAFDCVRSAFDNKHHDTQLDVVIISYIPIRDLPIDLRQFKNHIKIKEMSLKHFRSDINDKRIVREEYYSGEDMIIEVDQECLFMTNWDILLLNDLDKCPPGSVITTIPGMLFGPYFIRLNHDEKMCNCAMNHVPPRPVPSLFWSGILSCSKSTWISEEFADDNKESGQTYTFFKNNIALYAPSYCPLKVQRNIPQRKFHDINKSKDLNYKKHIGLLHDRENKARAICGLTSNADVSEHIAKYGSKQLSDNKCLEIEKII